MALDIDTALGWRGKTVLDRDGEKIGKLGDVYLDRETDAPAYAAVHTGLFGSKETFVRLEDAEAVDDDIRVPYEKAHVVDAPQIDPEVALTADEERRLDAHYDGGSEPAAAVSGGGEDAPTAGAVGAGGEAPPATGDQAAPTGAGDAPVEMVRSEEEARLHAGDAKPAERVRLKKVVVTDEVERTVPVRREEVRLEHDPPPEGRVVDVQEE
jgi:sporulation protein YlmC with PRC-barrel domain